MQVCAVKYAANMQFPCTIFCGPSFGAQHSSGVHDSGNHPLLPYKMQIYPLKMQFVVKMPCQNAHLLIFCNKNRSFDLIIHLITVTFCAVQSHITFKMQILSPIRPAKYRV